MPWLFATAEMAVIIWIGVVARPCPKELVAQVYRVPGRVALHRQRPVGLAGQVNPGHMTNAKALQVVVKDR